VGSANTSKLDNASIDAKVSSSPVLQKRGIQSGKTSHASFTTVQENQQRHLLVKKSITNRIGIEQFSLGRKLGEGKYGVVHMALHPQTGGIFAIKKISKSLISTKKMINQYSL
jgi:serine/threonine protein kinase